MASSASIHNYKKVTVIDIFKSFCRSLLGIVENAPLVIESKRYLGLYF